MAKATVSRQKQNILEEIERYRAKRVRRKKSPKRKLIRVDSEETQDYVREAKSAEQEEVEESFFCTKCGQCSAKMMFRCDMQCSEMLVINEGEEAYTTNLCQKCFNNSLKAKGEKPLANVQWRHVVEKKPHRGRIWRMMGKEPYVRGMWECFLQESNRVKTFREQAEEEKQAGKQGQWQLESPAREYMEQVKCCHDTDRTERMIRKGLTTPKGGWRLGRILELFQK